MIVIVSSFIKDWLKEIVVLFIIISLVDLIMPKGKMKRYVDFIIGILIIFTIISPFTKLSNIKLNLDEEVNKYTQNLKVDSSLVLDQNRQIEKIYKSNLNNEIERLVEENTEYKVKNTDIVTISDKENLFKIDRINITLSASKSSDLPNQVKIEKINIGNEKEVYKEDDVEFTNIQNLVASYLNLDTGQLIINKEDKSGRDN